MKTRLGTSPAKAKNVILFIGDGTGVALYPDRPFLRGMTAKAIQVLSQYPNDFFLMVEGTHIDDQSQRMDPKWTHYDMIQLDLAVQVALDFAMTDVPISAWRPGSSQFARILDNTKAFFES